MFSVCTSRSFAKILTSTWPSVCQSVEWNNFTEYPIVSHVFCYTYLSLAIMKMSLSYEFACSSSVSTSRVITCGASHSASVPFEKIQARAVFSVGRIKNSA